MTEQDFFNEIDANPNDVAPVLVFADWLEDRGDNRAELLRLIVADKYLPIKTFRELLASIRDINQRRMLACDYAERAARIPWPIEYVPIESENALAVARAHAKGEIPLSALILAAGSARNAIERSRVSEQDAISRSAFHAACGEPGNAAWHAMLYMPDKNTEKLWQHSRADEYLAFGRAITPLLLRHLAEPTNEETNATPEMARRETLSRQTNH